MKDNNKIFLPIAIVLGLFIALFAALSIVVAITGNVRVHKGNVSDEAVKEESTESVQSVYDYNLSDYKSGNGAIESSDSDSDSDSEDDEDAGEIESRMEDKDGYIFANSDSEEISTSDLEGFTAKQLCYAYNEIFARHNHKFDADELKDYFSEKSWYKAKKKFNYKKLSDIEKKNIDTIKKYMEDNNLSYKPS